MTRASKTIQLPRGSLGAGSTLFVQSWLPEAPPRSVLVLAHGYAEHLGRYDHFAEAANKQGFAVYALDHWGHGRSDGTRGFVPSFSVFTDGLDALLSHAKTDYPSLPFGLVGHSMGGLIAAHQLLAHQNAYQAALLSGPAVQPGTPPSALTRLIGRALSSLIPKAGLIQLDAQGVSRDPDVVAAYLADPLVYKGKMSARLAAEMLDAMQTLGEAASAIRLPLLVMHGSNDTLAAPEGGRALVDAASSAIKEYRLLDGLFHEIFNEPEKDMVINQALAWLDTHLS